MKKLLAAGVVAAVLLTSGYVAYLRWQIARRDAVLARAVATAAVELGAVRGEVVSERELAERLGKENLKLVERLKQIDKRVVPSAHIEARATIQDTVVLGPDEHRFVLAPDLKTLLRHQKFSIDALIVTNVDGSRLGKLVFHELDPETDAVLDVTPELETRFQFVKEKPYVGVFHPRVIVGVESHGYPVAGAQVLNGERLERFGGVLSHANLSLFGGYNTRDKTVFGGATLGWRLFNSNVSVGPAVLFGSGGASFGAAAAIELTR